MERERTVDTQTPAADSDRHLVARVRLSDVGAFEQLFRRYYEPVRRLLYRTVEDDDLADDLVQETFLALYTHPPQLQLDDEELRAWLYRVALNRGYNALRSRRRSQAHLPALYSPDAEVDPEAEALRTEERKRVRDTLALLSERQAKLLLLRQEEGLKYAEIAAILEVAPGSIGTLLVRAERAFELAWNQLGAQQATPGGLFKNTQNTRESFQ
jgi:RNA polymerase sigma-70 factor (ECF subfamily)